MNYDGSTQPHPHIPIAITFYDEEDIWKNNKNEVVSKETFKITQPEKV